ncbi:MAG: hypothetical protein RL292_344 [Candidatus Parcubacteria bacterium]|jgi:hypothetical protein
MIEVRMSHGVAVLSFNSSGQIAAAPVLLIKGPLLTALTKEIDRQYAMNRRQFVINITPVTRIDEDAAIELVKRRSLGGIRICFYDMQKSSRNIFAKTPALTAAYYILNSEEAAIKLIVSQQEI